MVDIHVLEKLESALQDRNDGISLFIKRGYKPFIFLSLSLAVAIFAIYKSVHIIRSIDDPKTSAQTLYGQTGSVMGINTQAESYLYVDLSGSVVEPDTYKVRRGTRLFELVRLAGGLSPEADKAFVQRNYNFAIMLNDQQKIHIPSIFEVREGIFTEHNKLVVLDQSVPAYTPELQTARSIKGSDPRLISLNNSSLEELKVLPGVGDVIGQQIMAARPYADVNDLLNKGIVKQSLYDKIVGMLEL